MEIQNNIKFFIGFATDCLFKSIMMLTECFVFRKYNVSIYIMWARENETSCYKGGGSFKDVGEGAEMKGGT